MNKFINCEFNSDLSNVILSRGIISSFFIDEEVNVNIVNEVKTIVSEAVTNAIIHGYKNIEGTIELKLKYVNKTLTIEIIDKGVGIEDIVKAKEPLYSTSSNEERAGLGFTIMEIFSDHLEVISKVNEGTHIIITKFIA